MTSLLSSPSVSVRHHVGRLLRSSVFDDRPQFLIRETIKQVAKRAKNETSWERNVQASSEPSWGHSP